MSILSYRHRIRFPFFSKGNVMESPMSVEVPRQGGVEYRVVNVKVNENKTHAVVTVEASGVDLPTAMENLREGIRVPQMALAAAAAAGLPEPLLRIGRRPYAWYGDEYKQTAPHSSVPPAAYRVDLEYDTRVM